LPRAVEGSFGIRRATRADLPLILGFIRDLAEFEGLLHEVVATEALLDEWLFTREKAEVLIGESEGQPVGFLLYFHNFSTFLGRGGIYLEDLYIKPRARGRGYGTRMLEALAAIALERGCGRLEWSCLDWNSRALDFYRALGALPMSDWTVWRLTGDTLRALAAGNPTVADSPPATRQE